jgi:hypothetical protein
MVKKRKTALRPTDIAWQAFQAGVASSGRYLDIEHLNQLYKAWWERHPQTTPDGELKEED